MKTIFTLCFFALAILLVGCSSGPGELAEKYMDLVCTHHQLDQAIHETENDRERDRLLAKKVRTVEQLEKLNERILSKYQGDAQAMEVIREVTVNYQCKED